MSLRDDLLTPIEGENPAGVYVGFDPVWDEIKEARKEESDLPQGEWVRDRKTADYAKVLKLGSEVLATQSKDLQLATWVTEAAVQEHGIDGLRDGLALLNGLLDQYWDHMYPELEDGDAEGRVNQLQWLSSHRFLTAVWAAPLNAHGHGFLQYNQAKEVGREVDATTAEAKQRYQQTVEEGGVTGDAFVSGFAATSKAWYKQLMAALDGSLESLAALDAIGDEKFGSDAPGYQKLRDAVEGVRNGVKALLTRKLVEDPDPIELEAEPEAESVAGTDEPMDTAGGGGGGGVTLDPKSDSDAAQLITAAALYLQQTNPCNPASYLMLRGYRWGELRINGEHLDPRMLSAPPTAIRTKLKGLLLDGKWSQLLQMGESVMATPNGRGWLDLQRYTLSACQNLGADYDVVAAAIRGALAQLLRDLPGLLSQTLMDDTPTANEETKAWLRNAGVLAAAEEQLVGAGAGEATAGSGRGYGRSVSDRAADLLRGGQPQKAVEILMAEVATEKSERARFFRRTEAAGAMVESGFHAVAMPILRELRARIDNQTGLEGWEEGKAVARPLDLLHQCIKAVEGESSEAQELYVRVCRLDPLRAMAPPPPPPAPDPPPPPAAQPPQADGGQLL